MWSRFSKRSGSVATNSWVALTTNQLAREEGWMHAPQGTPTRAASLAAEVRARGIPYSAHVDRLVTGLAASNWMDLMLGPPFRLHRYRGSDERMTNHPSDVFATMYAVARSDADLPPTDVEIVSVVDSLFAILCSTPTRSSDGKLSSLNRKSNSELIDNLEKSYSWLLSDLRDQARRAEQWHNQAVALQRRLEKEKAHKAEVARAEQLAKAAQRQQAEDRAELRRLQAREYAEDKVEAERRQPILRAHELERTATALMQSFDARISEIEEFLLQAKKDLGRGSYSKFWNGIEVTYVALAAVHRDITVLTAMSDEHKANSDQADLRAGEEIGDFPVFAETDTTALRIMRAVGSVDQLADEALLDVGCATIWEIRRNTAATVAGFGSLESAMSTMSTRMSTDIGNLVSSIKTATAANRAAANNKGLLHR